MAVAFDIPTTSPATPTFADVESGNWAYPYVETMYKMLLLDGSEYFLPQNKITREEMVSGVVMALGNDQNEITSIEAIYHTFRDAHLISPVLFKKHSNCQPGWHGFRV